jgi:hypothetical protein
MISSPCISRSLKQANRPRWEETIALMCQLLSNLKYKSLSLYQTISLLVVSRIRVSEEAANLKTERCSHLLVITKSSNRLDMRLFKFLSTKSLLRKKLKISRNSLLAHYSSLWWEPWEYLIKEAEDQSLCLNSKKTVINCFHHAKTPIFWTLKLTKSLDVMIRIVMDTSIMRNSQPFCCQLQMKSFQTR